MNARGAVADELLMLAERLGRCHAELAAGLGSSFPRARSAAWLGAGADGFNDAMTRRQAESTALADDLDCVVAALRDLAATVGSRDG